MHQGRLQALMPGALALMLTVLAGCDRIPGLDRTDSTVAQTEPATPPEPETVEVPPSEPLPERIYFTLTEYAWYAQGEPLVWDNAAYRAGTGVVARPLSAMRKLGEYQGVDVYREDAATVDTALYVPVFPGYWQPFLLSDPAVAAEPGS